MPRLINITDERKRDAQVSIASPKRAERWSYIGPDSQPVVNERFIKATEGHDFQALLRTHGDPRNVSQALIDGDPEIDLELVGRRLGEVDRVWVRKDGSILYSARPLLVVSNPAGEETSRGDFVDVEATVTEDAALPWSGKLFPIAEVVRRFVLGRKVQLRHINGLTFDFLFEIAQSLHTANKMVLVGAGPKAAKPLIFQSNGSPFRGFLEGRVEGDAFLLVLHLSNLELKQVES